jgi:novobiocin biosynthesis protein NovU/D-mycarose 3-C-methyltransferase
MVAARQILLGGVMSDLSEKRETCRICGAGGQELLLDYGRMPLAGGFREPGDSGDCAAFPLRLYRCPHCTLMQVLDLVPADRIFRSYSYASSTTRTLRDHFAAVGPEIVERAGARGELAVEFGCNDGVLMRPLLGAGARALGVDPSDVALRASRERGWPLIPEYFTEDLARRIVSKYGKARLIAGANVFAHMDDIHGVVRAADSLLHDEGHLVLEVHYQGDLISLVQYDTVYHEHLSYFSLRSLSALFRPYGLRIADVRRIPIHSGSIRITVVRERSGYPESPAVRGLEDQERDWDVRRFVRLAGVRRAELRQLVLQLTSDGFRVAAYGAAGRVTILLNYCGLGRDLVDYVVDASPLRHGRRVPGVEVPIAPPERFHAAPPDYAILSAWNYEDEILAKERRYLSHGGKFIVPLPLVRVAGAARASRLSRYAGALS